MIRTTLSELAVNLKAKFHGGDAEFLGVSTDTRTIKKGELFVALAGPHYDGHKFIGDAVRKGAAAVIASKNVSEKIPYLKVEDTVFSLGEMAKFWRAGFDSPVVAVTGSNGKSTTKEMIAKIISFRGKVRKTEGNYNNLIGMPLTLLKWGADEWAAVIEMGMNAKGEIRRLTEIADPKVGVITTVTAAHLQSLHSVGAVAEAKGELFENMDPRGTAVINDEDPLVKKWAGNIKEGS